MKLHRLTARRVQTAKPGMHGDGGGLWLSVSETSRSWVFRWMKDGKAHAMGLGGFPAVSLEEARRKASDARQLIAKGGDPLEAKRAPTLPTFEQAARILHAELLPGWSNPKHGDDWINSLAMHAFGTIGALRLDQITPKHVADALRPIWLEKAETGRRVKQRTHAVMAWAWAHGHVESNPVDVVDYLLAKQTDRPEHMPAMPWRDIAGWARLHMKADSVSALALEFLILTACRSGEVRGAEWSEFDIEAGAWTIPAERMKAKAPHRVPLSPRAVEIVKAQAGQHERWVFPSLRGKQLTDMALTQYLRTHDAHSDTPGRHATAHGFRSSFRDWASENCYPRDLAERALAHAVENKVEAAYHRTDLLEQRRPMMAAWADVLAGKAAGSNVIPLRAA